MATIRFELRNKKEPNKDVPIYIVIEHESRRILKYPTGVKVKPSQWNDKTKEVRKVSGLNYELDNQNLQGFKVFVNSVFAKLKAEKKHITGDEIRKELDRHTGKDIIRTFENDFLGFILSETKKLPTRINTTTQQKFSKQTISKYNCLYNIVKEIEVKRRKKLGFIDIDAAFYDKFVDHLQSKGFQPNTIGSKYIAPLKTILAEAEAQGIAVNPVYRSRAYRVLSEEPVKIYLTISEIEQIEILDLSKNDRLDRVRDLFLLGYYTGQRWGDYSKINKKQFEKGNFKIMQDKTAKRVSVPVSENALAIMEKYNWKLPEITLQKFNDYIKEVAKLAGINQVVSHTRTKGRQKETIQFEKWELVSSHTARRSFATNMYLSNQMQMLHIMKITGHTTEKSFRKYICFDDDENAKIMRDIMDGKKQPSPLAKVV